MTKAKLYFTNTDPQEINDLEILNLNVSGNSTFDGNLGVGTTNPISKLHVVGDTLIEQNLYVSGISTFIGNVNFRGGNIIFGDTSGDNVIFNADVNSNIIPNTNNAYDLGSTTQRWRDGYFAGTVNIGFTTIGFVTATNGFVGVLTATRINSGFTTTTNLFVGTAATIGFVTATNGFVGVLTATRITSSGINVVGVITATSFASNVTTGTAPLTVSSTTLVTNLNADLLDGFQSSGSVGDRWTKIPVIAGDGVMEIGRYIDFHSTAADSTDFTYRLDNSSNGALLCSGSLSATSFVSNVSTGTAPLTVSSTTLVTNLNADLLDGLNAAITGANTIVRTDNSGNIIATGIVTSTGLKINTTADGPGIDNTNVGVTIGNAYQVAISRDNAQSLSINRNTDGKIVICRRSGVEVGSIGVTATGTSYNTSSDYRLKENITPLDGAIVRLQQLPVHRFNFIKNPETTVDGFLAHEAQEVVPECVTGTKDEMRTAKNVVLSFDGKILSEDIEREDWELGKIPNENNESTYPDDSTWIEEHEVPVYQGIDQSKLVPLLTAALQEAIKKIETLEVKVSQLEAP